MEFIRRILESEPAVAIGLTAAVLGLLVSFGVQISDQQINAIKDVIANLLIFAGALAGIRQSVVAPDTHAAAVRELQVGVAPGDDAA